MQQKKLPAHMDVTVQVKKKLTPADPHVFTRIYVLDCMQVVFGDVCSERIEAVAELHLQCRGHITLLG